MGQRADDLAAKFEKANGDLIAFVEGCSDDQWRTTTKEEGWSIGVTAHHVAAGYPLVTGLIQGLGSGAELPALTMEQIDQGNAQHAEQFAGATKAETVELLRSGGEAAAGVVRGLSDEQLDRSSTVLAGAPPMTLEQVVEQVLTASAAGHLKSIKDSI